jgi:methionyl aminopeptidase
MFLKESYRVLEMIEIKNENEIKIMVEGARLLAKVLEVLKESVSPGITTKELNELAEALIFNYGAEPAFKDYQGFPATLCASLNEVIVHGLPSEYSLKEGDLLSLDIGLYYKKFFADMAATVGVGKISREKENLIRTVEGSFESSLGVIKPGNYLEEIGERVEAYSRKRGFNVIRELCGHGIGRNLHEDPQVVNYKEPEKTILLKEGMVFCIEPMISTGDWRIKKAADGFGWKTADNSLSSHYEHEVLVTKDGCRVLTRL